MVTALGGRAAEFVVFGNRSTGAENDMQQVTDLRAVPERQYELVLAGERCERRSRNRQIAALDIRRDGLAASRERIAPSAATMRTSGRLTSARDRRRTHTSGGGHAVTLSFVDGFVTVSLMDSLRASSRLVPAES